MKCTVHGYVSTSGNVRRVEVEVPVDVYSSAEGSQSIILIGLQFEEKINLLLENFIEWESTLLTLAQRYSVRPSRSHDAAMDERLLLDRRLVNLLTACKLYLDQSDHTLSEVFGHASQEAETINRKRAQFYDGRFGYRFMESLRNHIQHRALPITEIRYQQSAVDPHKIEYVELFVIPGVSREDLKKDRKFKPKILEEIEDGPEVIDIRSSLREYISSIAEIHDEMRRLLGPPIENACAAFVRIRGEFSVISGVRVDLPTLTRVDDSSQSLPFEELALDGPMLGRYEELRKRDVGAKNLNRIFASNGLGHR